MIGSPTTVIGRRATADRALAIIWLMAVRSSWGTGFRPSNWLTASFGGRAVRGARRLSPAGADADRQLHSLRCCRVHPT
jgi:hypothetical protein